MAGGSPVSLLEVSRFSFLNTSDSNDIAEKLLKVTINANDPSKSKYLKLWTRLHWGTIFSCVFYRTN